MGMSIADRVKFFQYNAEPFATGREKNQKGKKDWKKCSAPLK
jgi:hypothetical protein